MRHARTGRPTSSISREFNAVSLILQRIDRNEWVRIASEASLFEIEAIPDEVRRDRVLRLLPPNEDLITITEAIEHRVARLEEMGIKSSGGSGGRWLRCVPDVRRSTAASG